MVMLFNYVYSIRSLFGVIHGSYFIILVLCLWYTLCIEHGINDELVHGDRKTLSEIENRTNQTNYDAIDEIRATLKNKDEHS
jgi:hypothetical protein